MSTTTRNTKSTMTSTTPTSTAPTSTDTTDTRPGFWASVRDDLRERREARALRANLYRELDGYHSRSDILDLLAAADRHDGPQAELMRSILQSKLAHAGRGSLMVG
ncbi:MAG: hypothetical protein IPF90_06095 [Actinomycetales bacterium]|nr:hypothetical protein [Candidatus Phosphoribacter baldrii]